MKRFLVFLVAVGLVLTLLSPALATTVVQSAGVIELTSIDADWSYTTTGVKVHSIIFIPAALDDRCLIRDGSATGPVFFDSNKSIDAYDAKRIAYDGREFKPFLKYADGQYGASARVIIILGR